MRDIGDPPMVAQPPHLQAGNKLHPITCPELASQLFEVAGSRPLRKELVIELEQIGIHVVLPDLISRNGRQPASGPLQIECASTVRQADSFEERNVADSLRCKPALLLAFGRGLD